MVKHLLDLTELNKEEALRILELSKEFKERKENSLLRTCEGMKAALIFEKPSTRTRVSLEVAISLLGAHPVVLSSNDMQLSRGEDIKDTTRVLSRYVDAICARVYEHQTLSEMSVYASVPVVNALSDKHHPLQAIADVFTLYEKTGGLDFTLAYVGDGNNVCHSLIIASSIFGFNIRISTPPGYEPDFNVVKQAEMIGGKKISIFEDPKEAVKNADAIYTDTWVSMGFDMEEKERKKAFKGWQVNQELMAESEDAYFMHCLPAHKGEEVTEDVFESERSIVFDQAENRLHTAAAVFFYLWKEVR
ncbi:MAG: ornithine carbamoyltransferase [Actinobacteria bacterium]|nr:ornithine carbamoyltransferase [Actinomycetota bacterium]